MRKTYLAPAILAPAMAAFALFASAGIAQAQTIGGGSFEPPTNSDRSSDPITAPTTVDTRSTRLGNRTRPARDTAPTPPSPQELATAAQAIAASSNVSCQVSEASLLGVNAEQQPIYEAACASGPGYILLATTPPQAVDCVVLAGHADLERSRDPAADVGMQCKLPVNTDVARVVRAYAQEADIDCVVDQGASIGRSSEGNLIYEVGCDGTDGYWIEKIATGWDKTQCLTVVTQNAACRFTTAAEQAASVKTMLAGSPAAACDVSQARYMGANANGFFLEAKCGAGDGYIARFDVAGTIQQTYPCAEAARIGGGCTLTVVAAAPAAPAPAATPATPE